MTGIHRTYARRSLIHGFAMLGMAATAVWTVYAEVVLGALKGAIL